jgi:hypothetical protein
MSINLNSVQLDKCIKNNPWDLGNKVLYDLCSNHFTHDSTQNILAKTWLIGRAYAAAIERRKNKLTINDNFYIDTVVPKFKASNLDKILSDLTTKELCVNTLHEIVDAHYYLTKMLFEITELDKRSFSSKYLHFHLPNLFFIYDSRAVSAMRLFVKQLPGNLRELEVREPVDREYSNFVYKCLHLRQTIFEKHQILLTPRQLDNLLIETANSKMTLQIV